MTADRLTRLLTAFSSFTAMLACLRDGYVPTLRSTNSGLKLGRIIGAHGYRVYYIK